MRDGREGGDVLDGAGREIHVRGRHEGGSIVDRGLERLQRHRQAIRRREHGEVDAERRPCQPLVADGREIQGRRDDAGPGKPFDRQARFAQAAECNRVAAMDRVQGGRE